MSEMATEMYRRPIEADEFYQMARIGILLPDEHVELIDGSLIAMPPIGEEHTRSTTRLNHFFVERLVGRVTVRIQSALELAYRSVPEPDIVLLRGVPSIYDRRRPAISDVLLVVEIGDSSRSYDRKVKLPLYAASGIPEVWLVDLKDRVINVFRDPRDGAYQMVFTARPGESVACAAFPEESFPVDAIVG